MEYPVLIVVSVEHQEIYIYIISKPEKNIR